MRRPHHCQSIVRSDEVVANILLKTIEFGAPGSFFRWDFSWGWKSLLWLATPLRSYGERIGLPSVAEYEKYGGGKILLRVSAQTMSKGIVGRQRNLGLCSACTPRF